MQIIVMTAVAVWAATAVLVTGLCLAARRGDTA